MNMWNQDLCTKAWNHAAAAHEGQLVPGSKVAYINHVGNVTMEAMAAIAQGEGSGHSDLLIQCCLLHDVIEDTDVTFEEVQSQFGSAVAAGVMALTKDKTLPTKTEQMADSLGRIMQQPKEIWMVKLCDRITNLQPPPAHWDDAKILDYRDEAIQILEALGASSDYLSCRLQEKIDGYVGL